MRERRGNLVDGRRLRLGAAASRARRVRLRLARPGARPAARRRHRGRPGDGDRVAAAVAGHAPPEHPAGGRADGSGCALGSRQACCPSSPAYRERSLALVERLAAPLRRRTRRWRCGTSATSSATTSPSASATAAPTAFRGWLRRRYGDLDALNAAWGTAFWSPALRRLGRGPAAARRRRPSRNPAQVLDWRRFCSDELLGQYLAERGGAAAAHPGRAGDHELHGLPAARMDYWRWAAAGGRGAPATRTRTRRTRGPHVDAAMVRRPHARGSAAAGRGC